MKFLDLPYRPRNLKGWEDLVDRIRHPADEVTIGIVGKYVAYEDSYKSLNEALVHGGVASNLRVRLPVDRGRGHARRQARIRAVHGGRDPRPGRFGIRGVAGMVEAIRYARERKIPFFGICLGLQCVIIECARNLCGLDGADSTEFNEGTPHRVIYKLRDLLGVEEMGGRCDSARTPLTSRRDRSRGRLRRRADRRAAPPPVRGEPGVPPRLAAAGLRVTGISPDGKFVEDRRVSRPPLVPGVPVPSGVQVAPARPPSAFPRIRAASYRHRQTRRGAAFPAAVSSGEALR